MSPVSIYLATCGQIQIGQLGGHGCICNKNCAHGKYLGDAVKDSHLFYLRPDITV